MEREIRLDGDSYLQENYFNKGRKGYFLVLNACLSSSNNRNKDSLPSETSIKAPITEKEYKSLKSKLAGSKAKIPILRVRGDLEVYVDYLSCC